MSTKPEPESESGPAEAAGSSSASPDSATSATSPHASSRSETNDRANSTGFGSLRPSRAGFSPARLGSMRPARPAQLDPAVADTIAGGTDPQEISEISHLSAAALLDRVRHSEDPAVVERVLTLVETVGVDEIAELWSHAEPDSLPGILWRLYLLRSWMRTHRESIARLWRVGEPVATTASAIAGIDQAPTEEDIARTADSILSGAFTGDFAVALNRAAAFTDVVALGLRVEAKRMTSQATQLHPNGSETVKSVRTKAARLLHTAGNLATTARDFQHGAALWQRGKLE